MVISVQWLLFLTILPTLLLLPEGWSQYTGGGERSSSPSSQFLIESDRSTLLYLPKPKEPLSLQCTIHRTSQVPLQNITWYHNNSVINLPSVYYLMNEHGDLYLPYGLPTRVGSGQYHCMVHTEHGQIMANTITVQEIYLTKVSLVQSYTGQSSITRLKCDVITNYHANITWFKDNQTLIPNAHMTSLPDGILQINHQTTAEDGYYACAAKSGDHVMTSNTVKVISGAFPKTKERVLVLYPSSNVFVLIGNPLVLECYNVDNDSSNGAVLFWKHNTTKTLPSEQQSNSKNSNNLIITSVTEQHAGIYACDRVGNTGQHNTITVIVQARPQFNQKLPLSKHIRKGEKFRLKCDVTGNPVPSVTWFKDGRSLADDGRQAGNDVIVDDFTARDQGVYQCKAENKYGSILSSTTLRLLDVKSQVVLSAVAISSSKVNLTWTIPAVPSAKRAYSIHYRNVLDKAEMQAVVFKQQRVIGDLRPFTTYTIYVQLYLTIAKELIEVKKSNSIRVTTFEKSPERSPLMVQLDSYNINTLDVSWLPPDVYYRNGVIVRYNISYWRKGKHERRYLKHVAGNVYSMTLNNLKRAQYFVSVCACTKQGCGPWSKHFSAKITSIDAGTKMLSTPVVQIRHVNKSALISTIAAPRNVTGYLLSYRNIMDTKEHTRIITINASTFDQILPQLEVNSEYLINVTAVGTGNHFSRPALVVIAMRQEVAREEKTEVSNQTKIIPPMGMKCHYSKQNTALVLTWQKPPFKRRTFYHVTYCVKQRPTGCNTITTTSYNMTLLHLLPGNVYDIEMTSSVRDGNVTYLSQIVKPERACALPEKVPASAPTNLDCIFDPAESKIVVVWGPPIIPNGRIKTYHIIVNDSLGQSVVENIATGDAIDVYTKYLKNIAFYMAYNISIYARNSVGSSPKAFCTVSSFPKTKKPDIMTSQPPSDKAKKDHHDNDGDDDITLGIIIGCVISVLFIVAMILFIFWNDPCRCRKQKRFIRCDEDSETQSKTKILKCDQKSSDMSESSSKHYQTLQKYYLEEASKESDRGLGMTPKNSHLCLDNEKIPFLEKERRNNYSADGSFDSQDSGIQGFNKLDKDSSSSSTSDKGKQRLDQRCLTSTKGQVETAC